jgi:hypothetical protein
VGYLLGFLSRAEQKAYLANPARGSRFLGQAVHRATAGELERQYPGRFTHHLKGPDFVDGQTGHVIELTTPNQVAAHMGPPVRNLRCVLGTMTMPGSRPSG